MKTHLNWIGIFVCLLAVVTLTGCATSGPRERYLEQIDPSAITNLRAYVGATNLEIRYPIHGKDAYALASWPSFSSVGTNFECRSYYTPLSFDRQPRGTRRSLLKFGDQLTIRDATEWQALVAGIFQGLMPQEKGHGVLVLVQGQEIALYRDKSGLPHVVRMTEKPDNIIIDHAFGEADFARRAIDSLHRPPINIPADRDRVLFVTDDDPAFVLIDVRKHLIVFISYPEEEDTQLSELPGWFTLRALNSLLIRGFVISALKNPVTLIARGLWHIGSSGAAALDVGSVGDAQPPPPLYTGPGMDLKAWEKHLDKTIGSKRSRAKVDLFINGDKYFPALIKSIENARKSVDVLVYIFGRDDYAVTIANVLKHRSFSIKVRVLMDELGSLFGRSVIPAGSAPPTFKNPADIKAYLKKDSKVAVRASTNPWLTSDHRKCIIIDSHQAYVGGMNIGRDYRYDWHDMMIRLTGPAVGRLEKEYNEAWAHASWLGDLAYAWTCLFDRNHAKRNEVPDSIDVRILRTATARMEIYRAQLEAIRAAKGYIYIENAYFSDAGILRELIRARRRGVDVRVILPAKNDSGVMQTSNLMMANTMVANGIRVYAYPGMSHVKAAIYDGWACVGSANMEKMSLRVSQELDIGFSDPATVNQLKTELFEADFKRAREIKEPEPMNWMDVFSLKPLPIKFDLSNFWQG